MLEGIEPRLNEAHAPCPASAPAWPRLRWRPTTSQQECPCAGSTQAGSHRWSCRFLSRKTAAQYAHAVNTQHAVEHINMQHSCGATLRHWPLAMERVGGVGGLTFSGLTQAPAGLAKAPACCIGGCIMPCPVGACIIAIGCCIMPWPIGGCIMPWPIGAPPIGAPPICAPPIIAPPPIICAPYWLMGVGGYGDVVMRI
jgi:hypothetical protein